MQPMNLTALCTEIALALDAIAPPEWIELIPAPSADGMVAGRDGRAWLFDAAARAEVISQFAGRAVDVVIDREHATELKAPQGDEAPAAAWVFELQPRGNGSLWGRARWTPRAAQQVTDREYRYLSPVFDFDPTTRRIHRLVSVALTNRPNLRVSALNAEESHMKLSAALLAALSLPESATESEAISAIGKLRTDLSTALNAERAPSLDRFVPRSDYDALMTRATNAEGALHAQAQKAHADAVQGELDAALKAGKITPASVEYHRASCSDSAGLERFRAFVGAAPVIAPDGAAPASAKAPATALNADEQRVCELAGISPDAFKAARASISPASA